MSTRGHSRPEPISRQTSTRSERTKRPLTEHREPEIVETDTDTDTEPEETQPEETEPEEIEPEQLKIELNQTDEELAEELERLQMAESKGNESKGKNTQEQAVAIIETANPNARLIGDPGIFSGKRTDFADWWRIMQLHLKFNNVKTPDNKIVVTTSKMKGGVAGFFAQKWEDTLIDNDDTADWDKFKKELVHSFSLGDTTEIARIQIEEFKQGNQHINDFIIKFGVLRDTAKIDETHAIFLLKRHVKHDIIKVIMGYPPVAIPTDLKEWISAIQSVGKGQESTQIRQDLLTPTGVTYGGTGQPMELGRKKLVWSKDGTPQCYRCDQYGHIGKECPTKPKKGNGNCYACGKFGHKAADCRSKGKTQFKIKVRSMNDDETSKQIDELKKQIEEIKKDFPKGLE
jgi:hypothetical protein